MISGLAHAVVASSAWRLFCALAIGLLIGIERERRKAGEGAKRPAEGVRTFALVALLGGLAAQTGSAALVAAAALFTALAALVGYWLGDRNDPGLTTEVALMVAFVLGVLAQSLPELSLGLGVVVTVLLAVRTGLHRFVSTTLSEQELRDGLIFSVAALVILPLLPDRPIDPFGIVDPFALWRLAVVLMGLSAAGYVATRLLGPRYGLILAGIAAGFISSSISIAALGGRARQDPSLYRLSAAGTVASIFGSLFYLVCLIAAADLALVRTLALPFAASLIGTMAYAALISWHPGPDGHAPQAGGRAFDVKVALIFAGLVGLFALISTAMIARFGSAGAVGSAIATGLLDMHAASVSLATLIAAGKLPVSPGALAIIVALTANMGIKIPAAFLFGPPKFGVLVSLGLIVLLVSLWVGYAFSLA